MLEKLIELDTNLLVYLNAFNSTFWDYFFWLTTDIPIWIPLYVTILYTIFKSHGSKGIWTALALIVVIIFCDQISSSILKPFFERPRPSREPALEGILHHVNNYRGGKFGFVSSHAANSFGLAIFSSLLFKNRWYSLFIMSWALVNSYSRIYLGVHYPGDVLSGAALGILVGWLVFLLFHRFARRMLGNLLHNDKGYNFRLPIYTGLLSIIIILLASKTLL